MMKQETVSRGMPMFPVNEVEEKAGCKVLGTFNFYTFTNTTPLTSGWWPR